MSLVCYAMLNVLKQTTPPCPPQVSSLPVCGIDFRARAVHTAYAIPHTAYTTSLQTHIDKL